LAWLRQRLNGGLISKQEMQTRIGQIEANMDKLTSPETARQFTMSIGIMQVKDAEVVSPNQTEKGKAKNLEESVSFAYFYTTACITDTCYVLEKSQRHD